MREAISRSARKTLAMSFLKFMISKTFAGIHVYTKVTLPNPDALPTIYFANHSSVWDFAITSLITYVDLHQDPFTMTAEKTMMPKAEWAGAFSVNYRDPYSVARTLKYCQMLLSETPNPAVWIYPQGLIYPVQKRPLAFKNGISVLLDRNSEAELIPVSIYYAFGHHTKPEAFLFFGERVALDNTHRNQISAYLEQTLTDQLDSMITDICNLQVQNYRTVISGFPDLRQVVLKFAGKPYPQLKTWGNWHAD